LFNLLESELNLTGIRHANCKIKDATEFKFTAFLLLLNTKHLFWVKEAPEQWSCGSWRAATGVGALGKYPVQCTYG